MQPKNGSTVWTLVIEPILVLDRVRARSSWFDRAEPSADRVLNRRCIAHMRCSKHYRQKPAMKSIKR